MSFHLSLRQYFLPQTVYLNERNVLEIANHCISICQKPKTFQQD